MERETQRDSGSPRDGVRRSQNSDPPSVEKSTADLSTADLTTVILECVRRAREEGPPNLQVVVHDEVPAILLRADPVRLHEVVATLLGQAANALAGRPGCITVSSGLLRLPEGPLPDALLAPRPERAEFAWFEIADDGPGMSHEVRTQLFSADFPSQHPNAGRGLAHVHDLIVAHGGTIQVESQLGQGTLFHVRWPLAPEACTSSPSEQTASPSVPPTFVVVDDDDAVRHVTAALLRAQGASCVELTSGDQLLAMLQRGETVDGVVLDEMMPNKTGRETLFELRAAWPELPVVMVSGHIDLSELLMLHDAQLDYLSKPFDAEELYSRLERLLRLPRRP
jgi:two-component system, cell cycle sensor histidine kinase and response regulator CckA